MLAQNLKTNLKKLIADFRESNAWNNSEEHIQTLYTSKVLELLGYTTSNIRINQGQDVKTGKKPDILLKDDNHYTLLVIESKDAKKNDRLDGKYQSKTFQEQLFEYCNAEGIYWGILTNFVEWRVYSVYQKQLYNNTKYAFHEFLWSESDKTNSIDLQSEAGLLFLSKLSKENLILSRGKWDTNTVFYPRQDEIKNDFFGKLKNWRSILRNYIHKNYSQKMSIDEIDLNTQKLIDRLIFVDYCADNQIISQDILHAILYTKNNLYGELKNIVFKEMDSKFNTELFAPTTLDELKISDEILFPIIKELNSIDFSRLSVHIIGEVYENYLAELLKKNKSKISIQEEAGKVKKKKQGIYYTPETIVDYIVNKTVGEILSKCKSEADVEKIRVLDPACGSGSFLIRVFDEFLNHYKRVSKKGQLFEFEIRRKILTHNIYGIDLDNRAVEIAKLNLMIKALEGIRWQDIKGKKLLPNLKLNIRCGNSLVSGDITLDSYNLFYEKNKKTIDILFHNHLDFYSSNEMEKEESYQQIQIHEDILNRNSNLNLKQYFKNPDSIKPINYPVLFPEVFLDGGFDCIVGNPPYIKLHNMDKELLNYCFQYYYSAEKKCDIYSFFIERSLNVLLKQNGLLGFIVSDTWLNLDSFRNLREIVFKQNKLLEITKISNPFEGVSVSPILFFAQKTSSKKYSFQSIQYNVSTQSKTSSKKIDITQLKEPDYIIDLNSSESSLEIVRKIETQSHRLSELMLLQYGIMTADNDRFVFNSLKYNTCKPLLSGEDIGRYCIKWNKDRYIDYKPEEMKQKKTARPGEPERFEQKQKIVFQRYSSTRIIASLDKKQFYTLGTTIIGKNLSNYSNYYLLAILNSTLISWWYGRAFTSPTNYIREFEDIPIKRIETKSEKELYTKLEALCKDILSLNESLQSREKYAIQIQSIDREIDHLVFDLYGVEREEL